MLVIHNTKTCLYVSSIDEEDERHKCSTDMPHAPPEEAQHQPELEVEANNTPVMELQPDETREEEPNESEPALEDASIRGLHVPDGNTPVEELQPDETREEKPNESELELKDASIRGLLEPDNNKLSLITEMLGAESSNGEMVKELSEAMTEWSWTYKHQRQRAIEAEILAERTLAPPLPWYVGRPCRFLKVEKSDRRIRMNVVQMDRPPEALRIVRENGWIRMQLMTYVGDPKDVDAMVDMPGPSKQVEGAYQETTSESEEEEEETDK